MIDFPHLDVFWRGLVSELEITKRAVAESTQSSPLSNLQALHQATLRHQAAMQGALGNLNQ